MGGSPPSPPLAPLPRLAFRASATDVDRVARQLAREQRCQEEGDPAWGESLVGCLDIGEGPRGKLLQDPELVLVVAPAIDLVSVDADEVEALPLPVGAPVPAEDVLSQPHA